MRRALPRWGFVVAVVAAYTVAFAAVVRMMGIATLVGTGNFVQEAVLRTD